VKKEGLVTYFYKLGGEKISREIVGAKFEPEPLHSAHDARTAGLCLLMFISITTRSFLFKCCWGKKIKKVF